MANNKNLKPPINKRSTEEAREISRKGGIKSGEARRKKRDMKAELLLVMDELITDKSGKKVTPRKAISVTLLKKALSGDLKAIKLLLEIIGEMPKEGVNEGNEQSTENAYIKWLEGLGNAD